MRKKDDLFGDRGNAAEQEIDWAIIVPACQDID